MVLMCGKYLTYSSVNSNIAHSKDGFFTFTNLDIVGSKQVCNLV